MAHTRGYNMSKETPEVKVLTLDNPVVTRRVPMNEKGCDNLRAIQTDLVTKYKDKYGIDVVIPFPTVIHMVLAESVVKNKLTVNSTKSNDKK
jgi:hypothetical protein